MLDLITFILLIYEVLLFLRAIVTKWIFILETYDMRYKKQDDESYPYTLDLSTRRALKERSTTRLRQPMNK